MRRGETEATGATRLRVRDVTVRFDGLTALDRVGFDVAAGTICGLVGPNGAGKTTLFKCISGLHRFEGRIELDGVVVGDVAPHRLAVLDLARTFESAALSPRETVLENIMIGVHASTGGGFLANALRLPGVRRKEHRARKRAVDLAEVLELHDVLAHPVAELALAVRKRVALARATAAEPRLLLLDEPASGLRPDESAALMVLVRRVRDALRVTVLLAEHHLHVVAGVCDRVIVLDSGRRIAEGNVDEVRAHPEVVRAYLGARVPEQPAAGRGELIHMDALRKRTRAGA